MVPRTITRETSTSSISDTNTSPDPTNQPELMVENLNLLTIIITKNSDDQNWID